MSMTSEGGGLPLIFMAFTLVSLVHSIVLMRVCMHVIDRVYPRDRTKDQ